MSNVNPIGRIVSPSGPDVTVTITLDTKTNSTELRTNGAVNRFVVLGMLQEHALALTKQLMAESLKLPPLSPKPNGGLKVE